MIFDRTKWILLLRCGVLVIVLSLLQFGSALGQETPDDPETEAVVFFNKGQDLHASGDLKGAIALYEKALKLIPDFPEAELQRGNAFLALGDIESAEASFRRTLSLRQDWSLALANLGSLLVKRDKLDEAKQFLKRAIEVDPENTPGYVAMATLAIKSNAPAAELRDLHKKIAFMAAASKSVASIWSAKANIEAALGEKKAAAFSATRSLEIDAKNISMLALLASIALDAADPAQADFHIARIEALEPSAPELPLLTARALIVKGKEAEALKFIGSVAAPTVELLDLKSRLASSISTDIGALEKRLESDPRNATVLGRLCSLHRIKEPVKSMEFCRRAAEAEPGNIEHAIGYGAAMLQARDFQNAAALFQKLLVAAPDNFTLRANFSTALFQLKRYNEAKTQFQWLIERQPENVAAYFFLAVSHDQLGELPDAAANYQIFLKKADPKTNELEIEKIRLRMPVLQRELDAGKGRKNARTKS
jgi:tetratricopeptide (TPR) repeat protein